MKGTIYDITYIERKMTINYWVGDEIRTFAGWIMLGPADSVTARKFGGRNRWTITTLTDIESVRLD